MTVPAEMGPGGPAGELHFDVRGDAHLLDELMGVLRTALSHGARMGMAGQTENLRWRINMRGEPIKVAFVGASQHVGRWESYAVNVSWDVARRAVAYDSRDAIEFLANTLTVKKMPEAQAGGIIVTTTRRVSRPSRWGTP